MKRTADRVDFTKSLRACRAIALRLTLITFAVVYKIEQLQREIIIRVVAQNILTNIRQMGAKHKKNDRSRRFHEISNTHVRLSPSA